MIPLRAQPRPGYSDRIIRMGAPEDMEDRVFAMIVREELHPPDCHYVSIWEPTEAELALLLAGGRVVLSCLSMQPPVMLTVEAADVDDSLITT